MVPLNVKEGITVIVATAGELPVLVTVKGSMFPVPEAASPMLVLLLDHAYVVVPPVLEVVKLMAAVVSEWQRVWFAGWFMLPPGFTVMVNDSVGPVQDTEPFE